MSGVLPKKGRPLRALLLGPAFPSDTVGGLHLALSDIVDQLNKRGWQVDDQIWAMPELENKAEPDLAHDSSTNNLIRRHRGKIRGS